MEGTTTSPAKRAFIEQLCEENRRNFGPVHQAVARLLSAGLAHPWMYVHELTQNARDAGARRVSWTAKGDSVLFQHDGNMPLDESHVRGIASLGASTKGLAAVGFMGVGFKSVFARFRTARVSGFGWSFGFTVGTRRGDIGSTLPNWLDVFLPSWAEDAPEPEPGYTTAFLLENPADPNRPLGADLDRIVSPEDPTPLAVLALRGLEEVHVSDVRWRLSANDGVVEVKSSNREVAWRWKAFVSRYRPDDAAMRRFLEVRQETQDQIDESGKRVEREVVALVPLDDAGEPNPPEHGRVYATLPTQVQIPFGFHLQADWLVNLERQNLRDVDGDRWQEAIIEQIPKLVRQLFLWLSKQPEACRNRGYAVVRDPSDDDGLLAGQFAGLRDAFAENLAGLEIVPIHSGEARRFCTPEAATRLPTPLLVNFGNQGAWRPDLLFGHNLMDESFLGRRGMAFARWLGWGRELLARDVDWARTLPCWWAELAEKERYDALFALWDGVDKCGWHDAPVVLTESGRWVPAALTKWLNEEPPTESEPSGKQVAAVLATVLPNPDERVSASLRARVNRSEDGGARWLKNHHTEVKLASLITEACDVADNRDELPLVEFVEWALHRGDRRDLVPLVMTEKGAVTPDKALLADPLVEGGASRRLLFPETPALVEDYAFIGNPQAIVLFLERLGVGGGGKLKERSTHYERQRCQDVADCLDVEVSAVEPSNKFGYQVFDYEFPFDVASVPSAALQDWLTREHSVLRGKGRRFAQSYYRDTRRTPGRAPAAWVTALQQTPWLSCSDGQRRKPGDVLLRPDPDYEGVPIAQIDAELAKRLELEGVPFGEQVSKSPTLRRLTLRGATAMSDAQLASLIVEAIELVESGLVTQDELTDALGHVKLRGKFPLERVVGRTGAGAGLRSDLSGWVISLVDLESSLADAVRNVIDVPTTTTGWHALTFLRQTWEDRPLRVEELRRHLAAAYRYVLDDADTNELLATAWSRARLHARLYGKRSWHPIGPELAVDDVQSPLIRRFLPDHRVVVASAHLGDTSEQVRRVANALGLRLLSDEISLRRGPSVASPPAVDRLRTLVSTLSSLEDRCTLDRIEFSETLVLHVGGRDHDIRAFVDDRVLVLAGEPKDFAVEAAGQLVEYFQLSQRGTEVAWLTGALFGLDNEERFQRELQILADALGVSVCKVDSPLDADDTSPEHDQSTDLDSSAEDHEDDLPKGADADDGRESLSDTVSAGGAGRDDDGGTSGQRSNPRNGERARVDLIDGSDGPAKTGPEPRNSKSSGRAADHAQTGSEPKNLQSPGRAADHARILVLSHGDRAEHEVGEPRAKHGGRKDDHASRKAVIEYESRRGRDAKAMPDNQPGFDILSTDLSTGRHRRIEVKGVQGMFEGEASVVLTTRQFLDALQHDEDGVEYWLYVVDSTETACPRVFPIPWTRWQGGIRYGFYANAWARDAEQPAAVTESGLTDLQVEAVGSLNAPDDRTLEQQQED